MPYSLTSSDGTVNINISDGEFDTSTSLTLPGPNTVGYGQYLDQNLLQLLENFASNAQPTGTQVQGQLWFDKFTQTLNVYTNSTQGYQPVSGITVSGTEPGTGKDGDIWFNTFTNQQYLYANGGFQLIGPTYTRNMGISGAIPTVVNDAVSSGVTHNIIQLQFGNLTIATFSSDLAFQPSPLIPGFGTIQQGITLNSTLTNTSLNTNIVGSVTGPVTGNLTGNVVATTLSGTLTGNVYGNVTASNVVTTSLTATTSLFTNVNTGTEVATNFSTGNAQITAGNLTGITNLTASAGTFTSANTGTEVATNFSTANAQVTGGNLTGITNLTATTARATNFSTANAVITGGSVTGVSSVTALTSVIGTSTSTNLTSTNATATNLTATNLTVGNVSYPSGWSIVPSGSKLYFSYNGTNVASLDTSGNFIALGDVTGNDSTP